MTYAYEIEMTYSTAWCGGTQSSYTHVCKHMHAHTHTHTHSNLLLVRIHKYTINALQRRNTLS